MRNAQAPFNRYVKEIIAQWIMKAQTNEELKRLEFYINYESKEIRKNE